MKIDENFLKTIFAIQSLTMIFLVFLERSSFGHFLFSFFYFEDSTITFLDICINTILLSLPVATNYRGRLSLMLCGIWIFSLTLFSLYLDSKFSSVYLIGAHAIRYLLPFALLIRLQGDDFRFQLLSNRILKRGLGLTFIFHGIEAINLNPLFLDYLEFLTERFLGNPFSERGLVLSLLLIGVVDILVGVLVFKRDDFLLYLYLFFWGFLTAMIRPLYEIYPYGILGFTLRVCHYCIPLFFLRSFFYFKLPTFRKEQI